MLLNRLGVEGLPARRTVRRVKGKPSLERKACANRVKAPESARPRGVDAFRPE